MNHITYEPLPNIASKSSVLENFHLNKSRNLSKDKSITNLQILHYGLKFVPSPQPVSLDETKESLVYFIHRIWNHINFDYRLGHINQDLVYINNNQPEVRKFKKSHIFIRSGFVYPAGAHPDLITARNLLSNFFTRAQIALLSDTIDNQDKRLYNQAYALLKRPDITVRYCDKNLGLVIFDTLDYNKLCLKLLDDRTVYTLINRHFQEATRTVFQEMTMEFVDSLNLSKKEADFIIDNVSFQISAVFHCLAKLHKNHTATDLKMRPIIGYRRNQIISKLSCIVVERLLPIVSRLNTVLKDSRQIIEDLEFKTIPGDPDIEQFLVSIDFVSLYTSIDLADLYDVLANKARLPHEDIRIIEYICDNNFFMYGNDMYRQTNGFAMGTNVAPLLANLYLFYKVDGIMKAQFYYFKRFIDDVFGAFKGSKAELLTVLEEFAEVALPLKITFQIETKIINFLDLFIGFSTDKTFLFKTYQKPLNLYAYIPSFSAHSWGVFKGFIIGELIRYMRTCSLFIDFKQMRTLFWNRLIARGYTRSILFPLFAHRKALWTSKFDNEGVARVKPFFALPVRFSKTKRISLLKKEVEWLNSKIPWAELCLTYTKSPSVRNLVIRSNLTALQSNFIAENAPVEQVIEQLENGE